MKFTNAQKDDQSILITSDEVVLKDDGGLFQVSIAKDGNLLVKAVSCDWMGGNVLSNNTGISVRGV